MDVETALKRCEDFAAMVRELADRASRSDEELTREALSGIGDACGQIQQLAHVARKALPANALNTPVAPRLD